MSQDQKNSYVVNNVEEEIVSLLTHKISGGIYRRYSSDGRITAVLERSKNGRLVYDECNYGFDDLDYSRISLEEANRILDMSVAQPQLREAVLKGVIQ